MPDDLVLLESLDLGSARGRKSVQIDDLEVVRSLTEDDLPALAAPLPVKSQLTGRLKIRHSHHQLAQLLAAGEDQTTCSLITGYSPSYISNLKHDPAFQELLACYGAERKQVFVETLERMRALGLSALDELQTRLEDDPNAWSLRELMEMAELMLIKPKALSGTGQASGSVPAVNVNVKFVTAQAQPGPDRSGVPDAAVDLEYEDLA